MQIPSPRSTKRARIEIVPLIDIIFFLLATFVMVSLSMVKNQGISVQLPQANSSSPQERDDYLSISVTADGRLYADKEEVLLPTLVEKLQAIKSNSPNTKIFITGDAKAEFQRVVSVLDETRKLGITKVAIETSRR